MVGQHGVGVSLGVLCHCLVLGDFLAQLVLRFTDWLLV